VTEFGKSELFSTRQLADVGVNIAIFPVSLLRVAMGAATRALDVLRAEGSLSSLRGEMQHRATLYELLDYASYQDYDAEVFNFTLED
jgi:methylisocitrate lyase